MGNNVEEMPLWIARHGVMLTRAQDTAVIIRSIKAGPLSRAAYIKAIESCLTGPFADWIRLNLAKLNPSIPRDTRRWEELAGELEYGFPAWVLHPVKSNVDRRKAVLKVFDRLRKETRHNHRLAVIVLSQKHELGRKRSLPKSKLKEFFKWTTDILDAVLASNQSLELADQA
jgi:hypothetical protein